MKKSKLILNKCEIDECQETVNLHKHHVIERSEENTTNDNFNLVILCPNCHYKIHAKLINIIGIYPSTKLPNKRTIIYEINGKRNLDLDIPYFEFKNKSFKVYNEDKSSEEVK